MHGSFVDGSVLLPKRSVFFCRLFGLPRFHGGLPSFMSDWMRLEFDPLPLVCAFQSQTKLTQCVQEQELGLCLHASERAAVLPAPEVIL